MVQFPTRVAKRNWDTLNAWNFLAKLRYLYSANTKVISPLSRITFINFMASRCFLLFQKLADKSRCPRCWPYPAFISPLAKLSHVKHISDLGLIGDYSSCCDSPKMKKWWWCFPTFYPQHSCVITVTWSVHPMRGPWVMGHQVTVATE